MVLCSLDGNRTLHCKGLSIRIVTIVIDYLKLHTKHLTVQETVTISASAGTISTISRCPTYVELGQFCNRKRLGSPSGSQLPT